MSRMPHTHPFRLEPIVDLHAGSLLACEILAGAESCPPWSHVEWRAWYADLAHHVQPLPRDVTLFLNVDSNQLANKNIVRDIERILDARPIVLEWTERQSAPHRHLNAIAVLRDYVKKGHRIAVDDVGEGADGVGRSLSVLPHYAKLSMSLTHRGRESGGVHFLRYLNALFSGLGCEVIAEGVESSADADVCRAAGIRYAQGHHFVLDPIGLKAGSIRLA